MRNRFSLNPRKLLGKMCARFGMVGEAGEISRELKIRAISKLQIHKTLDCSWPEILISLNSLEE